jgi:hypothetical protein
MKHRILSTVLTAAALASVFASHSVQAQDTTRKDTTRKEATGDVVKPADLASVIASIDAIAAQTARFQSISNLSAENVKLIDVSTVPQSNDSLIAAAVEKNKGALEGLQKALEANAVLKEILAKNNPALTSANVVAINVTKEGAVEVFYKKA